VPVRLDRGLDGDGARVGVLRGVRQGLAHDLEQVGDERVGHDLRRAPAAMSSRGRTSAFTSYSRASSARPRDRPIRGVPGAELEDVVAQLPDRAVDPVDGVVSRVSARVGVPAPMSGAGGLEAHPDGEQRLDDPVVELAGDAVALVLDGQRAQPLAEQGVLDRGPGLGGEDEEELLVRSSNPPSFSVR
jgi:hypothetical protein